MVKQPVTRREFIGTTAAAGAGLLLTSCSPDSGSKPAAAKGAALTKLNIALIGCGAEGQVLLDSLLVIDGIRLAAIVDIVTMKNLAIAIVTSIVGHLVFEFLRRKS